MYSVIEAHAFCVKKYLQELFYRQPSLRISMSGISKSFSLLLIVLLAVSSLIMAKPAFAQTPTPSTIPKPSVPEFTITLISSSPESHFVNKTIECQPSPMVNIQSYHTLQDFLGLNTNTI